MKHELGERELPLWAKSYRNSEKRLPNYSQVLNFEGEILFKGG